jgi:hypothetical protein
MIPAGVEIYVALEPVDMRLSFDRLAGLAKEQVGYDARSGALFLFFGKRRDQTTYGIRFASRRGALPVAPDARCAARAHADGGPR